MSPKTIHIRTLVDSFETDRLVPDCYDEYRPLVKDALLYFFERLSRERRDGIDAVLDSLPKGSVAEVRAMHVMRECPALHKLGQVLARHEALDEALRLQLQMLEHCESEYTPSEIRGIVKRELGTHMKKYRIKLDTEPLAEGSVAVVLGCQWQRPSRKRVNRAVLKVLKPGIETKVEEDLELLAGLADYLDERRERYEVPSFEFRETLDTVRDLLIRETHLEAEQSHLGLATRFYAAIDGVRVPRKLPFSGEHVTAMERVDGDKITATDALVNDLEVLKPRELASQVLDSLISKVVFSRSDVTLFHADPHAGNLFATEDGNLAILDWALVGRLSKDQREELANMMWAALRLDARGIRQSIKALSTQIRDRKAANAEIDAALQKVRSGRLPGPTWLGELFDGLLGAGVKFPADLLLFRKSLFTIKGVIADLDPRFSIDREFFLSFAREMASEVPRRMRSLPFSHDFRTQLSNLDLVRAYLTSPITLAKYAGAVRA